MKDTGQSIGEANYEGYSVMTAGKTFDGKVMLAWADLPEPVKAAWEYGAGYAIALHQHRKDHGT